MTAETPQPTTPESNQTPGTVSIAGEKIITSSSLEQLQAEIDMGIQYYVRDVLLPDGEASRRFVVGYGRMEDGTPVDIIQTGRELPSGAQELQFLPSIIKEAATPEVEPDQLHVPEEIRRAMGASGLLQGIAEKLKGGSRWTDRFISKRIKEHSVGGYRSDTSQGNPHIRRVTVINPDNPDAPQRQFTINTVDIDNPDQK